MHDSSRTAVQLEEQQRAISEFERVLRLHPEDGVTRAQLALLLRNAGMLQRAEAEARHAVQSTPRIGFTHHVLGLVFVSLGALELSEQALANAARLTPADGSVWNSLARTRQLLGHKSGTIDAFTKAVECSPETALYHANLAKALVESGRHDESVGQFREAIRLSPEEAGTWNSLGLVYDELGMTDEARNCYRQALKYDPGLSQAYVNLLVHHDDCVTEADLAACNALVESGRLDGKQSANLLLALAQVEDRRGAYQEAAGLLRRANQVQNLWHETVAGAYDPRRYERVVDLVVETFTEDFLRKRAGWGIATDVPLFVFGLPRSGTTLTEQFLAAHPAVHGAGELMLASGSFALAAGRAESDADIRKALHDLSPADIQSIAQRYLDELRLLGPGAARIVDKMPENYLYAGWLALLFPKARFICCVRDFRDTALSAMITIFRDVRWSSDQKHLLHFFAQFRRLYDHWQGVLAGRIRTVHYSETVAEPERTARALVAWADLQWDPACLDHRNPDARIRTASLSQARRPVYRSSVARWRNYEPYMGDLFAKLSSIDPFA